MGLLGSGDSRHFSDRGRFFDKCFKNLLVHRARAQGQIVEEPAPDRRNPKSPLVQEAPNVLGTEEEAFVRGLTAEAPGGVDLIGRAC